jgi:hypothetical protein
MPVCLAPTAVLLLLDMATVVDHFIPLALSRLVRMEKGLVLFVVCTDERTVAKKGKMKQ